MHLIFCFLLIKGDVYPVEASDGFTVNQVLDAHWGVLIDEDVSLFLCTSSTSNPFSPCKVALFFIPSEKKNRVSVGLILKVTEWAKY